MLVAPSSNLIQIELSCNPKEIVAKPDHRKIVTDGGWFDSIGRRLATGVSRELDNFFFFL